MAAENVFTKVSTRGERVHIYKSVLKDKIKILCQASNKKTIPFFPVSMEAAQMIVTSQEEFVMSKEEDVIVSFGYFDDNFFLKTKLKMLSADEFAIDLSADLYKVQRRDLFRVPIPAELQGYAEVKTINGYIAQEETLSLVDLSGGGFALEAEPGVEVGFKSGDHMLCKLFIGKKFEREVEGEVRYIRDVGSRGSGLKRFGIQFSGLSDGEKQEITRLVMDIHREAFSRFS